MAPVTPRLSLLGVPLDLTTREAALARCRKAILGLEGPLQVVTLNPEMVVWAGRAPELAETIRRAGLVLADGSGISWAARRMGLPLPERIPGADFLVDLCGLCAQMGRSVFLLGGREGVAEAAYARLRQLAPGLELAGAFSPRPDELEEAADRVRASGASVVAVALGVPGQDLWLGSHLVESGCRVGIGVGGSLDYLSGRVRRAPAPLRRAGLEWSWRLLRQPWRLARMVRGSVFFWRVLLEGRG